MKRRQALTARKRRDRKRKEAALEDADNRMRGRGKRRDHRRDVIEKEETKNYNYDDEDDDYINDEDDNDDDEEEEEEDDDDSVWREDEHDEGDEHSIPTMTRRRRRWISDSIAQLLETPSGSLNPRVVAISGMFWLMFCDL